MFIINPMRMRTFQMNVLLFLLNIVPPLASVYIRAVAIFLTYLLVHEKIEFVFIN